MVYVTHVRWEDNFRVSVLFLPSVLGSDLWKSCQLFSFLSYVSLCVCHPQELGYSFKTGYLLVWRSPMTLHWWPVSHRDLLSLPAEHRIVQMCATRLSFFTWVEDQIQVLVLVRQARDQPSHPTSQPWPFNLLTIWDGRLCAAIPNYILSLRILFLIKFLFFYIPPRLGLSFQPENFSF